MRLTVGTDELGLERFEVRGDNMTLSTELARKLEEIFKFLQRNRDFNEHVQHCAHRQDVLPWLDTGSKLRSLLYSKANTQSAPKLDLLAQVWEKLHIHRAVFDKVQTVGELVEALWLIGSSDLAVETRFANLPVFEEMWLALRSVAGFGEKTAALFVKSIVEIHTLERNRELRFLQDFIIDPHDTVNVPVDKVILHIFSEIGMKSPNFTKINAAIRKSGLICKERPTLWDDLWFWGFITQKGDRQTAQQTPIRRTMMNAPKFWSILGAPADQLPEVTAAAATFITIVAGGPAELGQ